MIVVWVCSARLVVQGPSILGLWSYQCMVSKMGQGISIQLAGCGRRDVGLPGVFRGQPTKWPGSLLPTFYWPVTWPHLTSRGSEKCGLCAKDSEIWNGWLFSAQYSSLMSIWFSGKSRHMHVVGFKFFSECVWIWFESIHLPNLKIILQLREWLKDT